MRVLYYENRYILLFNMILHRYHRNRKYIMEYKHDVGIISVSFGRCTFGEEFVSWRGDFDVTAYGHLEKYNTERNRSPQNNVENINSCICL